MTIVTADGEIVTVSADDEDEKKRDLFWAVRGGGGGNFGVTVSMKCRIHRLRDSLGRVVCGTLSWDLTEAQQRTNFNEMMDSFNTHKCPDELCVDALWNYDAQGKLQGGMTVIYNGDARAAYKALEALLDFGPTTNTLKQMHWTDWVHQSEGWDPMSEVYHHHASFIFAEGAITPEVNKKISDLVNDAAKLLHIKDGVTLNAPNCHILWDHIGAQTEKVAVPDTPFYWRKGHYVTTVKAQWTDPKQGKEAMEFIAKCKAELLPYAIEHKAAYLNYIDGTVHDYQEAYYGKNYPRLQKVKTEWDPKNFFWNMQSIQPLDHGKARDIPGVVAVPSVEKILHTTEAVQTLKWWEKYAPLITPKKLDPLQTPEEVYALDNVLRRQLLASSSA